MSKLILLEEHGSIATLTLNRPKRHNSLIPALLHEMLTALEYISSQTNPSALIVAANGKSFSTGGDVLGFYEHMDDLEAYARETVGLLNQVILALIHLPIPVIAAVQGIVTGGSLGLVLACDLILLAPEATFTPYYSVVGFSPDGGWTALLPNLIGEKRVAGILMQNETITADQGVKWGLANQIIPKNLLLKTALDTAQEISQKGGGSIHLTKRLLTETYGDLAGRLEDECALFVEQIITPEAHQGIATFLGK
jgi:2-(1,2-epoxy-1,2-dihydrophenyl)acetyl-CoA isomerase